MPFSGPSKSYALGPAGDYNLVRTANNDAFEHALQLADQNMRASSILGQSLDRQNAQDRYRDETSEQLAMAPGVSQGGARTPTAADYAVSDSPLLAGPSHQFTRIGHTYTYDPIAAAAEAGVAEATKETSADQTRYNALTQIPGITPRQAARMTYGRSGVLDQPDPGQMRQALASYLENPSRETAAAAVRTGADLRTFPDRFMPVESQPGGGEVPTSVQTFAAEAPMRRQAQQEAIAARGAQQRQDIELRAQEQAKAAAARGMTGRQSVITKNQQSDDLMQQFEGDRVAAESSPEAQRLGLTGDDFFLAEGRYRARQSGAAQRMVTSGASATPSDAIASVRATRGAVTPTGPAARAHWDAAMAQIRAKQEAGTPLSDADREFLTHPRP